MAFSMSISPKPSWYTMLTAIESLPTTVPNCNSLIESPTDTRKNKSYDNIENDRSGDDNNNNDDDVDCSPQQDNQPVLPQQDILPNATDALPSLIESTTDTPTAPV